jgi:hypothetical protein
VRHKEIDKPKGAQANISMRRQIDGVGQLRQSGENDLSFNRFVWADCVIYGVK